MATPNTDFPSGFTPEKNSSNEVLKELKSINETLLGVVKNLNKTSNSKIFSDSNYFENIQNKYSDRSDKRAEETLTKKATQLNATLKKQEELLNKLYTDYAKEAKEKIEDIRRRRLETGRIQPEERELNRERFRSGMPMVPEGIGQAFMNMKDSSTVGKTLSGIGTLTRGIHQSKGGRTFDQYRNALSERQGEAEKQVLKSQGIYNYNPSDEGEAKELVGAQGSAGEQRTYARLLKKIERFSGSGSKKEEREIPTTKEDYSTTGISPLKVKSVLGSEGVGFLYLGEVIKENLGKDTKKEDKEKEKKDLGLDDLAIGAMITKLLAGTAFTSALAMAIPLIMTAATLGIVVSNIKTAIKRDEDVKNDLIEIYKDEGLTEEEAIIKAGQAQTGAKLDAHKGSNRTLMGGADAIKKSSDFKEKWQNILNASREGDIEAQELMRAVRNSPLNKNGSGRDKGNLDHWEVLQRFSGYDNYKDVVSKYHNGGIIGQKELLAQKGEVILPVDDSQYGLDSGILKKTDNDGISINRNAINQNSLQGMNNVERLLQELISVVNTNLIGAIKENKPDKTKPLSVPNLNLNTLSYRG